TATDTKAHDVKLFFQAAAELTVNTGDQPATGDVLHLDGLSAIKLGSVDQPVLESKVDDLRIDCGFLYLAASIVESTAFSIANQEVQRARFIAGQPLPEKTTAEPTRADNLAGAVSISMPKLGSDPQSRWLVLAYDDLFSIEYMGSQLRPYWRRNGADAAALLADAARDRQKLTTACDEFDRELTDDLRAAGGEEYAAIATLAYR